MNKPFKIDFEKLGMPVFSGRPRGEKARTSFRLDELPTDQHVVVIIPDDVYTVTSSYFLGFFGPSVRRLGSGEAFLNMFEFHAPEHIRNKLDDWITRALREKGTVLNKTNG